MDELKLGYGTIRAGNREWGHVQGIEISEELAHISLQLAIEYGCNLIDTAPSYNNSEKWCGSFLKTLSKDQRDKLIVATKVGENYGVNGPYAIWGREDEVELAKRSIDRSLELLGKIDLLQIHKADVNVLQTQALKEAIAYARSKGINNFGASISTIEAAQMACEMGIFSYLQFPLNVDNQKFLEIFPLLREKNIIPLINRPLAMGELVYSPQVDTKTGRLDRAMRFLRRNVRYGYVLLGTANPQHMLEDYLAFNRAVG